MTKVLEHDFFNLNANDPSYEEVKSNCEQVFQRLEALDRASSDALEDQIKQLQVLSKRLRTRLAQLDLWEQPLDDEQLTGDMGDKMATKRAVDGTAAKTSNEPHTAQRNTRKNLPGQKRRWNPFRGDKKATSQEQCLNSSSDRTEDSSFETETVDI